jgi:SAM-dependent methyltransferase
MNQDHEINRASWDELAAAHGQDDYYDSEALVAGANSLIEEEEAALCMAMAVDLNGRRVLHLQCHLGFDAITFARRGALVTGVDFSAIALDKARTLADRASVEVEWLCADATDLPITLRGRFDLVWATIGVLCWIGDLRRWMRSVAGALAPGGRLVLIDGHPLGRILKAAPLRVARPYMGARVFSESGCDYATRLRTGPQVQHLHTLGEIVSSAAEAGLRISHLHEHVDVSHGLCNDQLTREEDGRFRRRIDGFPLPVLFTMIASAEPSTSSVTVDA